MNNPHPIKSPPPIINGQMRPWQRPAASCYTWTLFAVSVENFELKLIVDVYKAFQNIFGTDKTLSKERFISKKCSFNFYESQLNTDLKLHLRRGFRNMYSKNRWMFNEPTNERTDRVIYRGHIAPENNCLLFCVWWTPFLGYLSSEYKKKLCKYCVMTNEKEMTIFDNFKLYTYIYSQKCANWRY